jgi:hypothetical protein
MKARILLFLLCLAVVCLGCSSPETSDVQPAPTPDDPRTRTARAEREFQRHDRDADGEHRTAARAAVIDFVKASAPAWTVKGIASQVYEGNAFSMDAELESKNQRIVVTFDVRKFFSDSGDGYWLAVPVNKFRVDRFQALTENTLRKELGDAQQQLEDSGRSP